MLEIKWNHKNKQTKKHLLNPKEVRKKTKEISKNRENEKKANGKITENNTISLITLKANSLNIAIKEDHRIHKKQDQNKKCTLTIKTTKLPKKF